MKGIFLAGSTGVSAGIRSRLPEPLAGAPVLSEKDKHGVALRSPETFP